MSLNYRGLFEKSEVELVEKLVSKFQKTYPLMRLEGADDLTQECLIHWLDRKSKYDSGRGASMKTFMSRVVVNFLIGIRDNIHSKKRKEFYEAASFNAPHEEGEDSLESMMGKCDASGITADIHIVIKQLTPEQFQIYKYIQEEGLSLNAISK
ncbi:MAG: hypothetical protein KKH94_05245, partial [Candidatus Omnitrophica bacterium]|nr:hypothetical protein [Candidatus Omnitrophota bacterium]